MFRRLLLLSIAVPATMAALSVSAQPPQQPGGAAPTPGAEGRPGDHRSAFEGYQNFADEKVQSWKEANDTVGRIGGWRTYAKEAQEGAAGDQPEGQAPGAAGHGKH
jgi:hypothetical protein